MLTIQLTVMLTLYYNHTTYDYGILEQIIWCIPDTRTATRPCWWGHGLTNIQTRSTWWKQSSCCLMVKRNSFWSSIHNVSDVSSNEHLDAIQGSTLALARWFGVCFEAVGLVRATSFQDMLDRQPTGFSLTDHCKCFQNLTLRRKWDDDNTFRGRTTH